jgi:hypothetical protein
MQRHLESKIYTYVPHMRNHSSLQGVQATQSNWQVQSLQRGGEGELPEGKERRRASRASDQGRRMAK